MFNCSRNGKINRDGKNGTNNPSESEANHKDNYCDEWSYPCSCLHHLGNDEIVFQLLNEDAHGKGAECCNG